MKPQVKMPRRQFKAPDPTELCFESARAARGELYKLTLIMLYGLAKGGDAGFDVTDKLAQHAECGMKVAAILDPKWAERLAKSPTLAMIDADTAMHRRLFDAEIEELDKIKAQLRSCLRNGQQPAPPLLKQLHVSTLRCVVLVGSGALTTAAQYQTLHASLSAALLFDLSTYGWITDWQDQESYGGAERRRFAVVAEAALREQLATMVRAYAQAFADMD